MSIGNPLVVSSRTYSAADIAAVVRCCMALLFSAAAGFVHTEPIASPSSKLPKVDSAEPNLTGSGFVPNAYFGYISPPPHITNVELYGSAIGGDGTTGLVRTRWYHAFPHFYLLISGYTVNKNCGIYLDVSPRSPA